MKFVCLEGCSGVGKTTQFHLLVEYFQKTKLKTLGVVEKHYEPFKLEVNNWYKTKGPKFPFTKKDITNFAKARMQTFENNFKNLGYDLLIFDRYFYTSAAYQISSGLEPQEIIDLNKKYGAPTPNLTFLLDCDPVDSFLRSQSRNAITGVNSVFSTNLKKVRELRFNYYTLLNQNSEMELINTNRNIREIQQDLIDKIIRIL